MSYHNTTQFLPICCPLDVLKFPLKLPNHWDCLPHQVQMLETVISMSPGWEELAP